MQISYVVLPNDFRRALWVMASARRNLHRWLIFALMNIFIFWGPFMAGPVKLVLGAVEGVAILAACAYFWFLGDTYARAFRGRVEITWSDEGLEIKTSNSRRYAVWRSVQRWQEKAGVLLLYFSDLDSLVIPRRGFELEEALIDFRRCLTRQSGRRSGKSST